MRGAINVLTAAIIAILVILLAAALLVVILPNMEGINKWMIDIFKGNPPTGNGGSGVTVSVSEPFGSLAQSDPTGDSQPETSTRVACKIARAIQRDLLAHGTNPRIVDDKKKIQGADITLIATEWFIIEKNPATGEPWKAEDLTEEQLKKLKEYCSDTGSFAPCPSHLDEACVTAALSQFNASEVPLCGKLSVPGESAFNFGNKACSRSAEWSFNCAEKCGAADSVKNARAQASKFGNERDELEVDDTKLSATAFPPECKGADCTPQYSWTLYWDKSDKAYHYEIPKIPLGKYKGIIAPGGTAAVLLGDAFKNTHTRSTAAGFEKPEFRAIYNMTFVPNTGDYSVNSFMQDFKKRLGKIRIAPDGTLTSIAEPNKISGEGDFVLSAPIPCTVDTCYSSSFQTIEYKELYGLAENMAGADRSIKGTFSTLLNCGKLNQDARTVQFITNVGENTNLKPDHKYNAIVRKWKRQWVGGEDGGKHCIGSDACVSGKSGRFQNKAPFASQVDLIWCKNDASCLYCTTADETRSYKFKARKDYIDYSLVLVDIGKLAPDIVVRSVSLEPQKLTASPSNPNPTVTVTYDIANIGDVETAGFEVTVTAGADSKKITAPNIPAKGTIRQVTDLTPGLGADRVVVFADSKEEIEEQNEENNKGSATFSVEGTDILVSEFTLPANGFTKSPVQIDSVIENRGSNPVENFLVALVIDSKTISTQTIPLLQQSGSGREKQAVRFQWTPDFAGIREIKVIADSANSVAEVNEQNNERSGSLTIKEA